jgi:hypothetical protein
MESRPVRRVVTGHNSQGQAIIQEDGAVPRVQQIGPVGPMFHEVWNTRETPARIDPASGEPHEDSIQLAPPKNGTRIRVLEVPPEGDRLSNVTSEEAKEHFAMVGAGDASSHHGGSTRHAFMHKTETVDYGIVLEGELTLIMDVGETVVRAGDIVIQRGTNHGWANRSDRNCRIAFILIDGEYVDGLS